MKSDKIILNDLRPKRDFIYITDVIDAVRLCIEQNLAGYNIFMNFDIIVDLKTFC